eukprot:Awhi_evm1s5964
MTSNNSKCSSTKNVLDTDLDSDQPPSTSTSTIITSTSTSNCTSTSTSTITSTSTSSSHVPISSIKHETSSISDKKQESSHFALYQGFNLSFFTLIDDFQRNLNRKIIRGKEITEVFAFFQAIGSLVFTKNLRSNPEKTAVLDLCGGH